MKVQTRSAKVILLVVFLTAIALAVSAVSAQSGMSAAPANAESNSGPKTAEQVYKNIKVLKGIPADQLLPAMQFIAASLGTGCDHCHVQGHFDQDDKKPKETARKMMTMMFAINKDNFDGHREVTCNSCHNGALEPARVPVISDVVAMAAPPPGEVPPEKPDLSKFPPAGDIVDKYVQAIGGAAAIEKISSRVAKGTTTGFGGRKFPVDIYSQGDKSALVTHTPGGDSLTVYDGAGGWSLFPRRPARPMEGAELDAAKMDADLHLPLDLKKMFTELKLAPPQKIGDHDAYKILGMREGMPPVEFYFDEQSALLVRMVRYAESPVGRYPTRIDYSDYRDQGGVKIPFAITTAHPGNSTTLQIDQIQLNVPVDDSKFKPPASQP